VCHLNVSRIHMYVYHVEANIIYVCDIYVPRIHMYAYHTESHTYICVSYICVTHSYVCVPCREHYLCV